MKKNNKGFTLMEMLIVVSIIGVLVAIAVPTVSKSVTKSKQAADKGNLRAAIAEVTANYYLGEETTTSKKVGPMQAEWDGTKFEGMGVDYKGWKENEYVTVSCDDKGVAISKATNSSNGGSTP